MIDGEDLDFWADVESAEERQTLRRYFAQLMNQNNIPASALMFSGSHIKKIRPFARYGPEGIHEIHIFLKQGIDTGFHGMITGNLLFQVTYALIHYPQIDPEFNALADGLIVRERVESLLETCRAEALIVIAAIEESSVFRRSRRHRNPEGDEA